MKWFTTQTDEDRSHERIMAILESIDPVELFSTAMEPARVLTANPSTNPKAQE